MSDGSYNSRAAVRQLGGQTAMVMGGTAFTLLVGLPFQIYLARSLGTTGLGIVGIAEALVLTATGLLSFGLAPLAVRYIPEYQVTCASRAIRQLVVVGLGVLITVGALGAVLMRPLALALPDVAGIPTESADVLDILGLLLPFSMVLFFLAQVLRGFQEIRIVVLSTSILALTTKVTITLALFTTIGASVRAYALAVVLAQLVAALPMIWALWRLMDALPPEKTPTSVDWRAWASYAGTNYGNGLLNTLVGNLDRLVIGALLGPAAVGVFMVVRQLQQFPMVFHQMVLIVVAPVFARLKAAGDMEGLAHQMHLTNDWVLRLAAGLILLLAVQVGPVLALYGPDFVEQGTALMLLTTLAVAVNLCTGPVGILLNMTGHHVALLRVMVLTALVTFAGYFLLIPLLGVAGAGLAVLLGNLANKGAAIWLVQTQLGIRWYDQRFRGWILPSVAAAGVLFTLRPVLSSLDTVSAQLVGLATAALAAYIAFFGVNLASGLHEDDRELVGAVRARISRALEKRGWPS